MKKALGLLAVLSAAGYVAMVTLTAPGFGLTLREGLVVGALLAGTAMALAKRTGVRAFWFNVAFVFVAVAIFDFTMEQRDPVADRSQSFSNPDGFPDKDDELGHRVRANHRTSARLRIGDDLIYDVTYNFDGDGLRISPPIADGDSSDCILFFGGSYTFGEGVEDDETLVWLADVGAGPSLRTRNFGLFGYGPHHMLAAIESGFVAEAAHCTPRYAIYQAHPHHLVRAAGKWWWDHHGPRYQLDEHGRLHRNGNFDDDGEIWTREARESSAIARRLIGDPAPDPADRPLFYAIVGEAQRLLQERYPDLEFHVLLWDVQNFGLFGSPDAPSDASDDPPPPPVAPDRIHLLSRILPGWEHGTARFTFPGDPHPTPNTHRLLANYVVQTIVDGAD